MSGDCNSPYPARSTTPAKVASSASQRADSGGSTSTMPAEALMVRAWEDTTVEVIGGPCRPRTGSRRVERAGGALRRDAEDGRAHRQGDPADERSLQGAQDQGQAVAEHRRPVEARFGRPRPVRPARHPHGSDQPAEDVREDLGLQPALGQLLLDAASGVAIGVTEALVGATP